MTTKCDSGRKFRHTGEQEDGSMIFNGGIGPESGGETWTRYSQFQR